MKKIRRFKSRYLNENVVEPNSNHFFNDEEHCLIDTYELAMDDETYNEIDFYIDEFWDTIARVDKEYNNGFLITGNLGLWHGRKEIYPEYEYDLTDAVQKCLKSADDMAVYLNGGRLQVNSMHHDGTNGFWITALSDEGLERWEEYADGVNDDTSWLSDTVNFLPIEI